MKMKLVLSLAVCLIAVTAITAASAKTQSGDVFAALKGGGCGNERCSPAAQCAGTSFPCWGICSPFVGCSNAHTYTNANQCVEHAGDTCTDTGVPVVCHSEYVCFCLISQCMEWSGPYGTAFVDPC